MTIYMLHKNSKYTDISINGYLKRPDFGIYYIEEIDFDSDFKAGQYVGTIQNKDIVFIDKAEAYKTLLLANKKTCENLLKDYFKRQRKVKE